MFKIVKNIEVGFRRGLGGLNLGGAYPASEAHNYPKTGVTPPVFRHGSVMAFRCLRPQGALSCHGLKILAPRWVCYHLLSLHFASSHMFMHLLVRMCRRLWQ